MSDPHFFWLLLAAVLCANLLTAMFVWGCVGITRREKRGEGVGPYMVGFLLPLALLGLTFYISMGGT